LGWAWNAPDGDAGAIRAVLLTGSHAASVEAVRNGLADLASIDSWTYELLSIHRPEVTEGLRIIARGPLVAVTPIVTAAGGPLGPLRRALEQATAEVGEPLGVRGFVARDREAHDAIAELARVALHAYDGTLVIRAGQLDDYEYLGPIDLASNQLFIDHGHPEFETDESLPYEATVRAVNDGRLFVAERFSADGSVRRVGWVFISGDEGEMSIGQISVHPDWAQHGYGSALLDAVIRRARAVGEHTIILSTQSDVPWNQPWYEKFGFVVVPETEWTADMRAITAEQTEMGLDWSTRVHMRLAL
jgi:GNAT superfamily N-acetyltransferase